MYKVKGVGNSEEEARTRAVEALKERLWREVWCESVELELKGEVVTEVAGLFEVEIEI